MDPNLFCVDWEQLFEILVTIVIVAFLLERALALLFKPRLFIKHMQDKYRMHGISRFALIGGLLLALSPGLAQAQDRTVELYMPDGQLFDRPVRVYVSGIENSILTDPRLCCVKPRRDNNAAGRPNSLCQDEGKTPDIIARDQRWTNEITGETRTGTLLLFNLRDLYIPWYLPGIRVLPVLCYGQEQPIVSDREVYISHRLGAIIFTIIIIAPLIVILNFLSSKDERYLLGLLSTADGRMSVSLTQMFLWTVAVGASVLIFGITRLKVPHIPASLWVLMGLSVTTSVVSHFQTDSLQKEKRRRGIKIDKKGEVKPSLKHLLMVKLPNGDDDADLSKAQLLFWTVVTLMIFFVKSYVAGDLWDVPSALLILMGISQTGYVSRKQLLVQQEKEETRENKKKRRNGGKGKT